MPSPSVELQVSKVARLWSRCWPSRSEVACLSCSISTSQRHRCCLEASLVPLEMLAAELPATSSALAVATAAASDSERSSKSAASALASALATQPNLSVHPAAAFADFVHSAAPSAGLS